MNRFDPHATARFGHRGIEIVRVSEGSKVLERKATFHVVLLSPAGEVGRKLAGQGDESPTWFRHSFEFVVEHRLSSCVAGAGQAAGAAAPADRLLPNRS